MKRIRAVCLSTVLLLALSAPSIAQQIPYLNELFSRYSSFQRLFNEKYKSGPGTAALEALRKRGEEAFKRGNIPGIVETESEALAVLQGKPWDERQKFISSLTLEIDKLVVEPNTEIQVSLIRMFPSDTSKAFTSTPLVTFEIVEGSAGTQPGAPMSKLSKPLVIAESVTVAESSNTAGRRLLLADGIYWVVARVEAGGQKLIELRRPVYAISGFAESVSQLSKTIAAIKSAADPKIQSVAPLATTLDFQLQRLSLQNRTRDEAELNPNQEMDRIEAASAQLARGQNPFAAERGELERAYQSSDGILVPYRVYVPKSYDGSALRPLVVLLHGALGDEHYYFSDIFDPALVKGEAERRGWILAGVNARGKFGGYRGPSLEDTFEVVKAITRDYRIDQTRIYLTGHSMGGFGAWLVGAARPEMFAAIAPVSGGAPVQGEQLVALLGRLKTTPALVVHGARDGIVPPERSREMLSAAKKAGLQVNYLESPESDHFTVLAATFPAILDFFDKITRPAPEK